MNCLSRVLSRSIGFTAVLGAAVWVFAQGSSSAALPASPPLKVCSAKVPPACATAPKAIYFPDPEYTEKARKKKVQGVVVLETTVGTDGRTYDIRVVQSAGNGLDEQAVKALRKWKFEPGTMDRKPVSVSLKIEMDFRLY